MSTLAGRHAREMCKKEREEIGQKKKQPPTDHHMMVFRIAIGAFSPGPKVRYPLGKVR